MTKLLDNLKRALSMIFMLAPLLLSGAQAQTPAGTDIVNQASVSFDVSGSPQPLAKSNPVVSTVPAICGLSITPDGTLAEPARELTALPGMTTYLPYRLVNTGNSINSYDLNLYLDMGGDITPESLELYHDLNGNGRVDEGEPGINRLENIAAGESVDLLAALTLADDESLSGELYVNLAGSCLGDPAISDEANVTLVTVPEGGVSTLEKSADPADGNALMPGQPLTYTISFEVNGRALEDVVLEDQLDSVLEVPTVTVTVNGVAQNDAAVFDEESFVLQVSFERLEPGDRVEVTLMTGVREDAPGNYPLDNQADLRHADGEEESNAVSHTVSPVCLPDLSPSGDLVTPAHRVVTSPGEVVALPYSLRNDGNVTSDFDLTHTLLALSTVTPKDSYLVVDTNGNGALDAGEDVPVTSVDNLAAGAAQALLLVVSLPDDETAAGDLFFDVIAACASDATQRDEGNVSHLVLPLGGFSNPVKESEPVSGTPIAPGGDIHYTVRFEVNARPLDEVELRDPLSPLLGEPYALSAHVNGREVTGALRYDAATHTVIARFERLEVGSEVELSFSARAVTDVVRVEAIENTAFVESARAAERATNTVVHELTPIDILLVKEAEAERVQVGETLGYTLKILNPSSEVTVERLELVDDLPESLRYVPGSARVTYPDGTESALEPELDGQTLTWRFETPLPPNGELLLSFDTTVTPAALTLEEIVNRAQVLASDAGGSVSAEASAAAVVIVEPGVFEASAVLLGTVFVDVDRDGLYDDEVDRPVAGVRLYLSDGRSLVTDEQGRYTFLELRPGLNSLRVDTTTLPPRLLEETLSETTPGLWRVRLEPGLITRQDIPLLPPGARLDVSQRLELEMGPVVLEKRLLVHEAGITVILSFGSDESLNGFVLEDALPEGAVRSGPVTLNGEAVQMAGQRFELDLLPAGEVFELRYDVTFDDNPHLLLTPPALSWRLR